MERCVDGHHVAHLDQRFGIGMEGKTELLLERRGESMPVGVVQLHIEGFEALEHRESDAACAHRSDCHPFEVVRARRAVRDVPAALHHPVV